jgi:CDP-paratose 2-epimerase
MGVALVTGSGGLIGSEAARFFAGLGMDVVGVDNDMRKEFFGEEASTEWNWKELEKELASSYQHERLDIRDRAGIDRLMARLGDRVSLIVHAAAQPSHDWAAQDPHTDFEVNALGTLNLLESTRRHCPDAVFIYCSTNKVYGDTPNRLPLVELDQRFEIDPSHAYAEGIGEDMSIDDTTHSLFGVSKAAADLLVQEYGRYFGIRTACFRGGCLTGPTHSGAELHGFLAYLMRCTLAGTPYTVFGYKGKQVRDNIHSQDLIRAFHHFYLNPQVGAVYNIGGGRSSNCSMLEAIEMCEDIGGRELNWSYCEQNRVGDHIWWISDNRRFADQYPEWALEFDVPRILEEIAENLSERLARR